MRHGRSSRRVDVIVFRTDGRRAKNEANEKTRSTRTPFSRRPRVTCPRSPVQDAPSRNNNNTPSARPRAHVVMTTTRHTRARDAYAREPVAAGGDVSARGFDYKAGVDFNYLPLITSARTLRVAYAAERSARDRRRQTTPRRRLAAVVASAAVVVPAERPGEKWSACERRVPSAAVVHTTDRRADKHRPRSHLSDAASYAGNGIVRVAYVYRVCARRGYELHATRTAN